MDVKSSRNGANREKTDLNKYFLQSHCRPSRNLQLICNKKPNRNHATRLSRILRQVREIVNSGLKSMKVENFIFVLPQGLQKRFLVGKGNIVLKVFMKELISVV